MRVLEAFETSNDLIKEGKKCEITFQGEKIADVWVRPADHSLNADYRREIAEQSIDLAKSGGLEDISDEKDREILWRVYARTIIVNWEFADPKDQKAFPFTEENAVKLFRKAPKFFEGIQRGALRWTEFRKKHIEDAAGN